MTKINTAAGDLVVPVVAVDPTEVEGGGLGSGELELTGQGRDAGFARRGERGMVSAEWTVGIIAAVATAGVLLAVVTAGPVESALLKVVLAIINAFARNI